MIESRVRDAIAMLWTIEREGVGTCEINEQGCIGSLSSFVGQPLREAIKLIDVYRDRLDSWREFCNSRYRSRFVRPALFVVVHVTSVDQAHRNLDIALRGGADGMFLIQHGGDETLPLFDIQESYLACFDEYESKPWIGVNKLQFNPLDAFLTYSGLQTNGVWCDDSFPTDTYFTLRTWLARQLQAGGTPLYFGGVAFKYRGEVPASRLGIVTCRAAETVDVVTTSGEQTGTPPSVEKILTMRAALGGNVPLAIASGISAENVKDYLPYVDAFLVASSISQKFDELDLDAVRRLADVIHAGA